MGAVSIEITAMGKDIREAFKYATEDARMERGDDIYNGGINNCEFIGDVTNLKKDKSREKLHEYIMDKCSKREVMGYCVEKPILNKNKTKTTVTNFPQKGTRKWETKYNAVNYRGEVYAQADSQTECIKKARKLIERDPNIIRLDIVISKELKSSKTKCATINYKPSKNEKLGTYVFIGLAPY